MGKKAFFSFQFLASTHQKEPELRYQPPPCEVSKSKSQFVRPPVKNREVTLTEEEQQEEKASW